MKLRLMIIISTAMLLIACNQLSMENYDRLETGMKYTEVTNIIGKPDSCDEKLGARSCLWGKLDGVHIKGKFINENAIFLSHKNLK